MANNEILTWLKAYLARQIEGAQAQLDDHERWLAAGVVTERHYDQWYGARAAYEDVLSEIERMEAWED